MGLWRLKIKQSRHGGALDTKWFVEEIERGRYDFGQPSEGHALDICLCSHTHRSGVTSNMLSAGTSGVFCCSLTALFHKEHKKSIRCSPTSVLQLVK